MWRLADGEHGGDQVIKRPGQVVLSDQGNPVIDAKMVNRPSRNRVYGDGTARAREASSSHGPTPPDATVSTIRRRMVPSWLIRVTTTLISSVCSR
jgi:hypothetical protein